MKNITCRSPAVVCLNVESFAKTYHHAKVHGIFKLKAILTSACVLLLGYHTLRYSAALQC